MTHTVTVANLKGGTGKTTTAMLLGLSIVRNTHNPCTIIDADTGNVSATTWHHQAEDWPEHCPVKMWPFRADHSRPVVIDVGPADRTIMHKALQLADIHVMPLAATPMDVQQLNPTLATVKQSTAKTVAVITQTREHAVATRELREYLTSRGVRIAETTIKRLDKYALASGTTPEDISEYETLAQELGLI